MLSGLILSAALLAPGADPAPAADAPRPLPRSAQAAPAVPVSPPTADPATDPYLPAPNSAAAQAVLRDTHLGPPVSMWVEGDYRLYWLKPGPLAMPLLVTSAPGQPLQTVLGGGNYEYGPFSGGGLSGGLWLNDRHTVGLGASGFLTEQRSVSAAFNSGPTGSPPLARPFTEALRVEPARLLVANPGTLAGGVWTSAGARFAGAEMFGIRNLLYCRDYSLDLLAGGRYLDLDENLSVNQVTRAIDGGTVVFNNVLYSGGGGPALVLNDYFRTRNQFWGGTLGLRGQYWLGPVFLGASVKGGIGNNHQVVQIDGSSSVAAPGVAALPGGLLAVAGANIGRHVTNRLAALSDVSLQMGVQVSPYLRVFVGYDFLYLSNVVRPGDQIDPIINQRLLTTSTSFRSLSGLTSPIVTGVRDDFFAHGVRFGMQLQY